MQGVGAWLERAQRFITVDLWSAEPEQRSQLGVVRLLQFSIMVGEGFVRDKLLLRASALTYFTVLSMVPLLAVAVSIVGAFAFPAPQGSQVYARDQALALRDAGAEVVMVCYGAGAGSTPPELEVVRIPRALSPLGLLSEDVDPRNLRQWGNFPQAYSHVGLIHAAFAASPHWGQVL